MSLFKWIKSLFKKEKDVIVIKQPDLTLITPKPIIRKEIDRSTRQSLAPHNHSNYNATRRSDRRVCNTREYGEISSVDAYVYHQIMSSNSDDSGSSSCDHGSSCDSGSSSCSCE